MTKDAKSWLNVPGTKFYAPKIVTPAPVTEAGNGNGNGSGNGHNHPYAIAVRAILDDEGIGQAELAARLNVTRALVNLWLTGTKLPSYEQAMEVERALHVEPPGATTRFLGWVPVSTRPEPIETADLKTRLGAVLPYVTDNQLGLLVTILEEFAKANRRPRRQRPE